MGTKLRLGGLVLAVVTIALIGTSAATAANANGNGNGNGIGGLLPEFTICHKPENNGGQTKTVNLADLVAHLAHGDSFGACQAVEEDEGGGQEDEETTFTICHMPDNNGGQTKTVNLAALDAHLGHGDSFGACQAVEEDEGGGQDDEETTDEPEETCEQQETCDQPEETCEQLETCELPEDDFLPTPQVLPSAPPAETPAESRSLFCLTTEWGELGDGTAAGMALDLPDSLGALFVEQGLATPAIFYAGVGVSCDVLPGFTYAGFWVDHVGDAVPGVAVYPYFVPTAD